MKLVQGSRLSNVAAMLAVRNVTRNIKNHIRFQQNVCNKGEGKFIVYLILSVSVCKLSPNALIVIVDCNNENMKALRTADNIMYL